MGDDDMFPKPVSERGNYVPCAIYYADADSLEYIRRDVPRLHRRVDHILTLVLDLRSREPVGFQFKGFKNFFLRHYTQKHQTKNLDFVTAVQLIEEALTLAGDGIFEHHERNNAYETALKIADEDSVRVTDLPRVA